MDFKIRGTQFRVPSDLPEVPEHPTEADETFYNGVIIRMLKAVLRMQDIRVTVFGAENLPAEGGALLAMNHTGYYDFIFGEIPGHVRGKRLVRFMAKREVFDVPLVGNAMRSMDHISVDRSYGSSSIDEAVDRLQLGQIVGIFPEATISRSFELKDFKSGAVRIAEQTGAPLVPMVTWGSQRIWTKGLVKRMGRSGTPVYIRLGAPVDTSGTPAEATARVKAAMEELLETSRAEYDKEYGVFGEGLAWRPASMGGSAPTLEEAGRLDGAARAKKAAKKAAKQEKKMDKRGDEALGNTRSLGNKISDRIGTWLSKLFGKR